MNKKKILQSLLLKVPAIKQTARRVKFEKVKTSFIKQQEMHKALGLEELTHPNQVPIK